MTRILMTADAVGGVWTYACELARALAVRGVSTTIATMGPVPASDQIASAAGIPNLDIVTSRYQLEWMDDPWRDVEAAGRWLLDLALRIRPDVVHLNGYVHAALPFNAPVVAVGHSCVLSWQEATEGRIDAGWIARYRAAVAHGLRSADWVVAPTAAMLERLQRHYGPLMNASVVSNGRSADRFQPGVKAPLVFSAGRLWDRAKNVEAMLEIAPRLQWPIVVAGADRHGEITGSDGADPHIDSPARMRSGVVARPGSAIRLGRLSEQQMQDWLGRASIFAHPARYEPFGLLPLEAALAGCALVLGDTASLREVWDDAALYVAPDDRDGLAAAIGRLASSETLLRSYAARAREKARTYTSERMAAGYLNVYDCVRRQAGPHPTRVETIRCAS